MCDVGDYEWQLDECWLDEHEDKMENGLMYSLIDLSYINLCYINSKQKSISQGKTQPTDVWTAKIMWWI